MPIDFYKPTKIFKYDWVNKKYLGVYSISKLDKTEIIVECVLLLPY